MCRGGVPVVVPVCDLCGCVGLHRTKGILLDCVWLCLSISLYMMLCVCVCARTREIERESLGVRILEPAARLVSGCGCTHACPGGARGWLWVSNLRPHLCVTVAWWRLGCVPLQALLWLSRGFGRALRCPCLSLLICQGRIMIAAAPCVARRAHIKCPSRGVLWVTHSRRRGYADSCVPGECRSYAPRGRCHVSRSHADSTSLPSSRPA